jgi:hypothetical protein
MANFTMAMDAQQASTQAQVYSGLLVSLCTIQTPSGNIVNGVPDNTFTNAVGLVNIPCTCAVLSDGSIQATEAKGLEEIQARAFRHIFLNACYPQLLAAAGQGWRAIVDGTTYDLLGAEDDSQGMTTRLHLQLVTL